MARCAAGQRGWFSLPSGLGLTGVYRVGVKPVTAPGLARLIPGNVTLSETTPPSDVAVTLTLGDATRDGLIDVEDLSALIQAFDAERDTDPNTAGISRRPTGIMGQRTSTATGLLM